MAAVTELQVDCQLFAFENAVEGMRSYQEIRGGE